MDGNNYCCIFVQKRKEKKIFYTWIAWYTVKLKRRKNISIHQSKLTVTLAVNPFSTGTG